jgi:integral membrane protein
VSVIRNLRIASVAEATSYLLLLVATIVKQTGGTETGVSVLGPVHGVLYLTFATLVLVNRPALEWDWARTVIALVVGSLPLGGFWLERAWLAPLAAGSGANQL